MAKFTYNNTKNLSTDHIFFELNYGYYLHVSYEEDVDLKSKSKLAEKLSTELRKQMTIC